MRYLTAVLLLCAGTLGTQAVAGGCPQMRPNPAPCAVPAPCPGYSEAQADVVISCIPGAILRYHGPKNAPAGCPGKAGPTTPPHAKITADTPEPFRSAERNGSRRSCHHDARNHDRRKMTPSCHDERRPIPVLDLTGSRGYEGDDWWAPGPGSYYFETPRLRGHHDGARSGRYRYHALPVSPHHHFCSTCR